MKNILFTLLLTSTSVFALTGSSLTWQKLSLEEKIQRRYNSGISTVLKDNQYLVEVEVEVNDPGAPNFGSDNKTIGPKVSDLKMEQSSGDYIAFSKVGLEVPVVEKFLDEDRTKLTNLYRFNETYDLFKNLSDVKVTVYLSDKLHEEQVEIVKKVISSTKFTVSGIKPVIKFESIPMEWIDPNLIKKEQERLAQEEKRAREAKQEKIAAENKEPKIWKKDWYEWFSRWGNAFGLIFGSLILTLFALKLFREWRAFMETYAAKNKSETKAEDESKDKAKDAASINGSPLTSSDMESDVATTHGFERFQQCLREHQSDAMNLIKEWINQDDQSSRLCLKAIAQLCSSQEMDIMFSSLTDGQREKWKDLISEPLDQNSLIEANKFIFQSVVTTLLVPSKIKDGELLNLIMELSIQNAIKFMETNKEHIGIMMNILGPNFVAKIIGELDQQKSEDWLNNGAQFSMSTLNERIEGLKKSLEDFKHSTSPSPFAQRIIAMIQSSTPSKERMLFKALAQNGGVNMVTEVAKKHFPAELVLTLPSYLIKEVILSYPVSKRVEIVLAAGEKDREKIISTFAEEGSAARDMINMEIENLENNEDLLQLTMAKSEETWSLFVSEVRKKMGAKGNMTSFTEKIIKDWIPTLTNSRATKLTAA